MIETDPQAEANYLAPRRKALEAYNEALDRLHLDGFVYPATQMPPPDETMPQDGQISTGPHSDTSWVNMIGVPAVVVPGGFYPDGLPFGLEISARPWKDGDLLGWAYAYEQATQAPQASRAGGTGSAAGCAMKVSRLLSRVLGRPRNLPGVLVG